ncbi:hypothetical protein IIC38_04885 [candidate division KSB1 bacterium]|nr:hypothetical protein [candidate division KSB1 bacterium]
MKKLISSSMIALLTVTVLLSSCQSLDVVNQNNPDEARALATPSDIESLIAGSFLSWFDAIQSSTPNMSLAMPADVYTCGWGNFGMGVMSEEPRIEFNNTSTSSTRGVVEQPWFDLYGAISAASDGIRNIQAGNVTLGADKDTRAIGFGKFVQGLAHGWLALMFDQGFILDENVDLNTDELVLQPYTEVMAAAIEQLEAAIVIFRANPAFTLPDTWINKKAWTFAELAQVAHSFIARYMVLVARDRTERSNVAWNTVMTHLDMGITEDFSILGDGAGRSSTWYSGTHWYSGPINWGTWQRVDYKLIGPSDTGTDYDDWINLNINDRDEFIFQSSDKRIWDGTLSPDGTQNPGTQFGQTGNTTFIRERYGFSRYGHTRFDHISASNNASDIVLFRPSELDFIRAEALLNTGGSTAEIAALLDRTHVIDGGYDSAASLAAGSISDPLQPQHDKGATLWSVLKYEKLVDLLGTFSGREYWEKRGWGELTPGNPIQFPVPAKDLETLQLMLYSFGGVGQTGGAPKIAVRPAGEDPKEWRLRR